MTFFCLVDAILGLRIAQRHIKKKKKHSLHFFVRGMVERCAHKAGFPYFFVRSACATAHKRTNCARFPAPGKPQYLNAT